VLYSNGLALDINLHCVFIMKRPTIYQRKILVKDLREMHHVCSICTRQHHRNLGLLPCEEVSGSRFVLLTSLHFVRLWILYYNSEEDRL
jgi:hypothetical protein